MKSNIQSYYKTIEKNNSQYIKFDISTILLNAKINKTFNKLLNLSIKFNIEIFNSNHTQWNIRNTTDILLDIINIKKIILNEYSLSISNLYNNEKIIDEIDKLSIVLKKNLKDLEILKYLFENVYNNDELKKMCYSSDKNDINYDTLSITSISNITTTSSNITLSNITPSKNIIKQKPKKYIAEYIN
jgi:hypothetical protein